MNIGIFTDTYLPDINGVSTSIITVSSGLKKAGHRVLIFAPNNKLKYEANPENNIWRLPSVKFYGEKNFRFAVRELFPNEILNIPLDVVHIQTPFPIGRAGLRLARSKKIRSVHTYHTRYQEYIHYLRFPDFIMKVGGKKLGIAIIIFIARRFLNKHDAIIAPSYGIKRELESFGVKKPITVIPTGIDIEKTLSFANSEDQSTLVKLKIDNDDEIVVLTSRLAKEKNIEFLLRAMKIITEKIPQARFIIIGDGDYKKYLEEQVMNLSLEDRVIFTGFMKHEQIFPIYKIAKVFLFSSLTETQGLSALEAMACGVPVVALKGTGIEDLLLDDYGGFLVGDMNPQIFADKVASLITNKDLHKIKSAEAYKRAGDYSIEKTTKALLDVFKDIVITKSQ
jgi:glycosyltransferase involved in cell wall biosynthesis